MPRRVVCRDVRLRTDEVVHLLGDGAVLFTGDDCRIVHTGICETGTPWTGGEGGRLFVHRPGRNDLRPHELRRTSR